MIRFAGFALLITTAVGCGGTVNPGSPRPDSGPGEVDASTPTDAGVRDSGEPIDSGSPIDAGTDAGMDAGIPDSGVADAGPCPKLMAYVPAGDAGVCIDLYEGAILQQIDGGEIPWPFNHPVDSLATGSFRAVPADGIDPQGYISADQGSAACDASGKRLCSLTEWLAACQGPDGYTYPYGNTYEPGACNEGMASPVYEVFGSNPSFDDMELNDSALDTLPNTVAPGGSFTKCVSSYGVFDMHGNVEEWVQDTTSSGHGIFKGGYFVDATINGPGCTYETTAHATDYHDYSTGFRCCADP